MVVSVVTQISPAHFFGKVADRSKTIPYFEPGTNFVFIVEQRTRDEHELKVGIFRFDGR